MKFPPFFFAAILLLSACQIPNASEPSQTELFYPDSKPRVRWWWLATEITPASIKHQLDWFQEQGFGGVEVSWVYPLYRYQMPYLKRWNGRFYAKDTTAQPWLSPEWTEVVSYTKAYSDSIGMSCDFSLGSSWPEGASYLAKEDGTQIYGDSTFEQTLTFSWEYPLIGRVVNHLDSNAFDRFLHPFAEALSPALEGNRSALFSDSWEIKLNATNKIWTPGFEDAFQQRYGYDLLPFMEDSLDNFPHVRYDYTRLLSDYVIAQFYRPFANRSHALGAFARGQCLASPSDIMQTYTYMDVPETEAMLNKPTFARIVSSSATLAGKKEVSCEAFTCLYGFPNTNLREEQTADLKLVADALFAQGVNQVFWHGAPYNGVGSDSVDFFATVYVGPNGSLTEELKPFNAYMQKVSQHLKKGRTYTDVAVYVPFEDGIMAGPYPDSLQRVWVWGQYELRYVEPPAELAGHHPVWINRSFLQQARFEEGQLQCGDASFSSLYLDVNYLDTEALDAILALARQGLPVCLKRLPVEPGHVKSGGFAQRLQELTALPNVESRFAEIQARPPLVSGEQLPDYWCRETGEELYLFFAHPFCKDLAYPLTSGDAFTDSSFVREVVVQAYGKEIPLRLAFPPYQSLLFRIDQNGKVAQLDIEFVPKDPVIKPKSKERMYF
jgi:hypothetical protein